MLATTRQRILTSWPFPNSLKSIRGHEASLCIGVTVLRVQKAALFCSNPSLLRYLFMHYPFGLKHVRLIRENRTRYKPRVGCQNSLDMSKLWAGQDHTYVVQEQKMSSEV